MAGCSSQPQHEKDEEICSFAVPSIGRLVVLVGERSSCVPPNQIDNGRRTCAPKHIHEHTGKGAFTNTRHTHTVTCIRFSLQVIKFFWFSLEVLHSHLSHHPHPHHPHLLHHPDHLKNEHMQKFIICWQLSFILFKWKICLNCWHLHQPDALKKVHAQKFVICWQPSLILFRWNIYPSAKCANNYNYVSADHACKGKISVWWLVHTGYRPCDSKATKFCDIVPWVSSMEKGWDDKCEVYRSRSLKDCHLRVSAHSALCHTRVSAHSALCHTVTHSCETRRFCGIFMCASSKWMECCLVVAQPQAIHSERTGLVLFCAVCGTVSANPSADSSRCNLT